MPEEHGGLERNQEAAPETPFGLIGKSPGLGPGGCSFESSGGDQILCPCGQIGKVISLKRRSSLSSNLSRGTNGI